MVTVTTEIRGKECAKETLYFGGDVGKAFIRVVYPYYQDTEGQWWTLNPQTGWVEIHESRALVAALASESDE